MMLFAVQEVLYCFRVINTLTTSLRYIRTSFRPKKQQFSVALPTP